MGKRLAGKVAIVTGAASSGPGVGNGHAVARLFAREGARVVLVNRSKEHAKELQQMIEKEGGEAFVYTADISQADEVEAMVNATVAHYGKLDILHNNVGIGLPGNVESLTDDRWHQLVGTNLTSAMLCCRYAVPRMKENGGGSIINISSIAASVGLSDIKMVGYSTTKAGMHGLTLSVAADYASVGIRANCIIVGMVHTPVAAQYYRDEESQRRRRLAIPLQTEGTGWDVAYAALYLASDEARWVTGVFLPVDGGFSAIQSWAI